MQGSMGNGLCLFGFHSVFLVHTDDQVADETLSVVCVCRVYTYTRTLTHIHTQTHIEEESKETIF